MITANADDWLMYPRALAQQAIVVEQWQRAVVAAGRDWKPFSQSLYIDLVDNPDAEASPIHLGYRIGRNGLIAHLEALRIMGVNHVRFNVKFSPRPVADVLQELGEFVIPQFPAIQGCA